MPMSSMSWDVNVGWLDIGAASDAFLSSCGPKVHLLSVEVSRPEIREVAAFFWFEHHPPVHSSIVARCASPRLVKRIFQAMGDQARRSAEEWTR